jgi:hypothetical protein
MSRWLATRSWFLAGISALFGGVSRWLAE